MRRSQTLLVTALLLVAPCAFAQQPMSPYGDQRQPISPYGDERQPISPYGDEPGGVVAPIPPNVVVPAPPAIPPPLVAPPPSGYYQQAPQPYYYQYPQPPQYAQPQPRLFHEETQPNYGLMVAGLVILGASWSINAASAYLADEWKLAVPVIGPFMETQNIYTGPGSDANRMLVGLLVFDGLIETAGAVMLVAGALTHHRVRVFDRPRVSVVPTVGPGSTGLVAFGRF